MADLLDTQQFEKSIRGINPDTFRKFGYGHGTMKGQPVHIAPFYSPEGELVAQHIRFKNKEFPWLGDKKSAGLWGQHLWRDQGKRVIVTEGEMDAMSISQLQGNKWPVVSIKSGAAGAVKDFKQAAEWLEGFTEVVICFDMDDPGQKAAKDAALVLTPGKAKIMRLPVKDANDMLRAGRGKELLDAVWDAKTYRPDGIVSLSEVKEQALREVEVGLPWFLDSLTEATYGRRWGEVYGFGAGTGVGKTDLFTQQIAYDTTVLGELAGVIYLEQPVHETAKRIAGKVSGHRFHVPDAGWTKEELITSIEQIEDKVFAYDHFGETDWDVVKSRIRYMAVSLDIKLIYLDHLTAMADPSSERESLETIMKEMAGLAQELGIIVHFISHLSTPEGKPHEEGGRVMIRHFKGSRAIGFWSYYMFGLERNQQADDPKERQTTTFRVLKDRYTGQATGLTIFLGYNPDTGMLFEQEECPFDIEDTNDPTDDNPFS